MFQFLMQLWLFLAKMARGGDPFIDEYAAVASRAALAACSGIESWSGIPAPILCNDAANRIYDLHQEYSGAAGKLP